MQRKTFPLEVKATDDDAGQFTALVSAFGNVDRVGDKILPGAFSKTLAAYRAADKPIPVVLSHQHNDVMAHIGAADPALVAETEKGLMVTGQLDVDENPVARQTYKLLKERRLTGFSFAYSVPEGGQKQRKGHNEISEVELFEVGPTLVGANPEAQLQAVKSMEALRALEEQASQHPEDEDPSDEEPTVAKSERQARVRQIKRDLIRTRIGR